ncbi:hypothetical protein SAMN05421853_102115 [Roseivivax halotolerans]|uniref:Uncharacterized protein n=1 Tax=Roseivivax halotolerans TaxID=93684 RepID=A0A1I5W422_9RHOB|nr:hypothetical protein [Roseivivax halotolerans]SFQ14504.1 hypothetical protein SAMN05421853_102115 [Roseivivax halotolerans]
MGMSDINNAAAAQNALTARMNAFLDDIDADIATRQAAYDALAADLRSVVTEVMDQVIAWRPSGGLDNRVDGGEVSTFSQLNAFLSLVPTGARVTVNVFPGETYLIPQTILSTEAAELRFQGPDGLSAGSRPVLMAGLYENSGSNAVDFLRISGFVERLFFRDVDFDLGDATQAGGTGFNAQHHPFRFEGIRDLQFWNCHIDGDAPYLCKSNAPSIFSLTLNGVEIDKATLLDISGVLLVSKNNVTLTSGGGIHNGRTLGTNLLEA